MTRKYDLVVVGAGPAGMAAAKAAAECGLRVALLERKADIPKVTRLDGGALNYHEYIFGDVITYNQRGGRLCFPTAGFSVPYRGPIGNVYGFQIYSPGGKRVAFGDWQEAREKKDEVRVGIIISKEILLRQFVEEAKACGVEVFAGVNVSDVKTDGPNPCVVGNGETFEGTFVIAADGVNSRLTRILGFNKKRQFSGTWCGMALGYKDVEPPDPGAFTFVITANGTYSVIPQHEEGIYHVGTFTFNPALNLEEQIEKFVKEDKVYAPWFKNAKRLDEKVNCVVNELSPIADPFKDNVLLIGDAAWIREFSNIAALVCGWKAGNAIALAFINGKLNREGLTSYFDWWTNYEPHGNAEFGAGELQDFLTPEDLDYLVGLTDKPLPPTMDFLKLFSFIGETYSALLPKIQKERPDTMERLQQMLLKMEDSLKQQKKWGFPNK
jgi:flavin-dependent dehydrogenase